MVIRRSTGAVRAVALEPKSVATFYPQTCRALDDMGLPTRIQSHPNEVDPAPPFAEDAEHTSSDPVAAQLFWRRPLQSARVLTRFRSRFVGKVMPVHFFWGAMDLACSRFSGGRVARHSGGAPNVGDWVMVEGYSHELSSCGFFPAAVLTERFMPTPTPSRTGSPTTRSSRRRPGRRSRPGAARLPSGHSPGGGDSRGLGSRRARSRSLPKPLLTRAESA